MGGLCWEGSYKWGTTVLIDKCVVYSTDNRTKYIVLLKMSYTWLQPTNKMCIDRLMSELSTSSLDYVRQYAVNPEQPCTSDIILQYTNVTASLLRTYTTVSLNIYLYT